MLQDSKHQFAQLMKQHKGIIYKVVNSYCQYQDDRQDLAQEILVILWLAFDKYDQQYKFSTWMYRIALNVAISHYRKDNRRQDRAQKDDQDIIQWIEIDCEADQSNAQIDQLYRFIGQLDKLNKAIMLLYLESMSHEDIASNLGISKTNVATRIGRIKVKLKQQFLAQES